MEDKIAKPPYVENEEEEKEVEEEKEEVEEEDEEESGLQTKDPQTTPRDSISRDTTVDPNTPTTLPAGQKEAKKKFWSSWGSSKQGTHLPDTDKLNVLTCLGLPNLGQTGHMNAVLQSLFTLKTFTQEMLAQHNVWPSLPEAQIIRDFFAVALSRRSTNVGHKQDALRSFQNYKLKKDEQDVAVEFFKCIMEKLWLLDEVTNHSCYTEVKAQFLDQLQYKLTCTKCGTRFIRNSVHGTSHIFDFNVVRKDSVSQLMQRKWSTQVKYPCPCGGKVLKVKQTWLTPPRVLVIKLKRPKNPLEKVVLSRELELVYGQYTATAFAPNGTCQYELVSVVSLDHGHYVCDGAQLEGDAGACPDQWLTYDDDEVRETTGASVCHERRRVACLLFYKQMAPPSRVIAPVDSSSCLFPEKAALVHCREAMLQAELSKQLLTCLGLPNLGQTSHMNAVLQSLFTLSAFTQDMLSQGNVWASLPEAQLVRDFKAVALSRRSNNLDRKQDALRSFQNYKLKEDGEDVAVEFFKCIMHKLWLLDEVTNHSTYSQVKAQFLDQLQYKLTCGKCGRYFTGHSVPGMGRIHRFDLVRGDSVMQLMHKRGTEEEFPCPCGGKVLERSETWLTPPPVLVIKLKRPGKTREKVVLSRELEMCCGHYWETALGLQHITEGTCRYKLVSVVSRGLGHYVCDGAYLEDDAGICTDRWLTYDDNGVTETTGSAVCHQRRRTAYMLFYEQLSGRRPAAVEPTDMDEGFEK